MDIINYFSSNHASLLFAIAGVALVLELAVMGLSGLLLFFSIGCFITATLTHFGIISGWESEVFSVGLFSCITALLLWKPLKRFQEKGVPQDNSSDMTGREVPCAETINKTQGAIRYSGINWPARLDSSAKVSEIAEGELCVIVNVDGNVMLVKSLI
jgi:membrane protein implicated in regulation of membrane protease activity